MERAETSLKEKTEQKNRIILVSHGNLAQAVLENVEMLMGPQENMAADGRNRDDSLEEFAQVLRQEIQDHGKDHVLFFSDLMNGTPYNILVMLARDFPSLHHITGMNLALVIGAVTALSNHSGAPLDVICERTLTYAEDSIQDVQLLLEAMGL